MRARLCGLLTVLVLALSSQAAQAQVEVDLALCIDGSGSIFQFSQAIVTELSPLVIDAQADMDAVVDALNDMVQEGGVTNTEGCIRTVAAAINGDELQCRRARSLTC